MSPDHSIDGSSAVGRELRDAREALGIAVSDMADALRIRAAHIEALEDGRFSDLPGRPYTLGFARSIARHLGLDPDAVAMRLRDEVTGVARPVELVFPESTEDKRLSRAGWIAISLVLVAAAYAAWLALGPSDDKAPPEFAASSSAPTLPEMIPPESDLTTSSEVEDKTPETTVGAAPAPVAEPPAEPVPPAVMETAPTTQPTPSSSVPTARVAPPPSGTVPAPPASSAQLVPSPPAPAAGVAPSQAPSASAPPRTAERQATTTPGSPASAPARGSSAAAPASGPPAAAAADEEEEDVTPEPSSVASASPLPAGRVMLRARQDSWVQIQAANGVTVMARTLRAGESYTVPEQSGLRLTTGNAGALDVIVDGQVAPALGQIGAVRRNVALDPARLKAGTALE